MSFGPENDILVQVINKHTGDVEASYDVTAVVLITLDDNPQEESYSVGVYSYGLEEAEVCAALDVAKESIEEEGMDKEGMEALTDMRIKC